MKSLIHIIKNEICRNLLLMGCLFATLYGQAQITKVYATKEDFIEDRYQEYEGVTLQTVSEEKQKKNCCAAFFFTTSDKALRKSLNQNSFIVEYNDSLYMNGILLKDAVTGYPLLLGYVQVRDQDNLIFFEAVERGEKAKADMTAMASAGFGFGLIGGAIAGVVVASRSSKGLYPGGSGRLPLLYYHYNPITNEAKLMSQEQLVKLLQVNDPELLKLYNREPYPEDSEVITLYARAFFANKGAKKP